MASSYYKPCKELDRCLELDKYWEKDMKGIELAILCILWILILPFSIKNLLKKDDEEE